MFLLLSFMIRKRKIRNFPWFFQLSDLVRDVGKIREFEISKVEVHSTIQPFNSHISVAQVDWTEIEGTGDKVRIVETGH